MSSKLNRLLLRLEQLEHRTLLAGNVSVRVDAGDLWILGDSFGNGITVEQLSSSPDGTPGDPTGLLITPDATTSINDMPSGAPLSLKGVTGAAHIDMGHGDDQVFIIGNDAPQLSSLDLSGGGGENELSASRLQITGNVRSGLFTIQTYQKMRGSEFLIEILDNKKSRPKASLSDVSSTGGITVAGDTFDLIADHVHSSSFSVSLRKGESKDDVKFFDSTFDGGVTITSPGPIDAGLSGVTGAELSIEAFDGVPEKKQKNPGIARLSVEGSTFTGGLSVESGGMTDLSLQQARAGHMILKLDSASSGPSNVSIDDSEFSGDVHVESTGEFVHHSMKMRSADMLLKLDGVKGKATVSLEESQFSGDLLIESSHPANVSVQEVKAESFHLNYSKFDIRYNDPKDKSLARVSSSTFEGPLTIESANLLDVSVEACAAVDMFLKLDGVKGEKSSISVSDSEFSGGVSIDTGAADVSVGRSSADRFSLNFTKIELQYYETKPSGRVSNSKFKGPLSIESGNGIDVSVESCAAVDMFLKLDGIKGEKGNISVSDSEFSGGVSIDSSGADVSIGGTTAESLSLNFNKFEIKYFEQKPSARLSNAKFKGPIWIQTANAIDVSVEATSAVDMLLKLDGIKGEVGSVSVSDSEFTGGVSIDSSVPADVSVGGTTAESLTLNFNKFEIKYNDPKDKSLARVVNSKFKGPLSIESANGIDVSVEATQAVDMFLKLDGIKGESSSTTISDSEFSGSVHVESSREYVYHTIKLRTVDMFLKLDGVKGEKASVSLEDSTFTGGVHIDSSLATALTVDKVSALTMDAKNKKITLETKNGDIDIFCKVSNSTFDGPLSIESSNSMDVSVQNTRAVDMFLKLDGVKGEISPVSVSESEFSGGVTIDSNLSPEIAFHKVKFSDVRIHIQKVEWNGRRGSVQITDGTSNGPISIDSDVALNVDVQNTRAADMFLKLGDIKGERSTTSITDSTFSQGVSITNSSPNDLSVSGLEATVLGSLWNGKDKLTPTRAAIVNSVLHGGLSIESNAPTDVSVQNTRAVDMFLKLDGVKGKRSSASISESEFTGGLTIESTATVDLQARRSKWDHVVLKYNDVSGERSSSGFSEVTVTKQVEISTTGSPHDVTVQAMAAVDMFLKLDGVKGKRSAMSIIDSEFSGGLTVQSHSPTDFTAARVKVRLPWLMEMDRTDTTGGASWVRLEEIDAADAVTVHGSADFIYHTMKMRAVDMFLKLDGVKGKRATTSITDSDFTGGVRIESSGQQDLSVSRSHAVDMFLKIDGIKGDRSSARITDSQFTGGVSIECATPMDVTAQALSAVHLFMKMGPAARVTAPGSLISLSDTRVSGNLSIDTGDGADDVQLQRVQVGGSSSVMTGAGNDRLRAIDCVFEGTTVFDGGLGNDVLEVRGSRFGQKPTLISWESITMSPSSSPGGTV